MYKDKMKKIIVDIEDESFAISVMLGLIYAGSTYEWYLSDNRNGDRDIAKYEYADLILTDCTDKYHDSDLKNIKDKLVKCTVNIEEEDLESSPYSVCILEGAKKLSGKLKYILYGNSTDTIETNSCRSIFLSTPYNPLLSSAVSSCICKTISERLRKKVMYISLSPFAPSSIFNVSFPTCSNEDFVRLMLRLKNNKLYPLEMLLGELEGFYILTRPCYLDSICEFNYEINRRLISLAAKYDFDILIYDLGNNLNGKTRKLISSDDDFIEVHDKERGDIKLVDVLSKDKFGKHEFFFGEEFDIDDANVEGLNKGFGLHVIDFIDSLFEEKNVEKENVIKFL